MLGYIQKGTGVKNKTMALTEEQKKRIEENRKRALEIRQQKREERERQAHDEVAKIMIRPTENTGGFISGLVHSEQPKRRKVDDGDPINGASEETQSNKPRKMKTKTDINTQGIEEDEESLEDFEYNASEYITKTEAQRTYCLPQGTLAVCSFIERDNPHKKGWSNMKLYSRSELRRRARKRFGGKEGLIREREKRKERRLEKDLEETKNVFG